jgi:hypothetical protein
MKYFASLCIMAAAAFGSSAALAQTAPPATAQETPPGYGPGRPTTEAEWRERHRALMMRVAVIEAHLERAREAGDEAREELIERDLDAAKEELERYEERTTGGSGGAIAMGAVMCGVGAALVGLAAISRGDSNQPTTETERSTKIGLGVGGGLMIGGGLAVLIVGTRKGGSDPPDQSASVAVAVGVGSVAMHGSF